MIDELISLVVVVTVFMVLLGLGGLVVKAWAKIIRHKVPPPVKLQYDREASLKWRFDWQRTNNPKRAYRHDPNVMLRPAPFKWMPKSVKGYE